jgi:hypothetical protein
MATLSCPKQSIAVYRPRRPEKTSLFQAIKRNFTSWHKNRNDQDNPVPRYIEKAFQKYLGCGILAKGFACAHCEGCKKDFFIAFSCKARGICPSCNQRAMVETASHLIDSVLPRVPFRQFVMSFPKRIRCYLENHKTLQTVLQVVVDEIRKRLIACSPIAENPQIGAISFIQHFGNTLNYHPHFHIIFADGIFSGSCGLQFYEAALTQDDITDTQEAIQKRVLRYFCNQKFFDKDEMQNMLAYENSGFSLDASVKVESFDKEALERLIRYCARPPFNSENVRVHSSLINYRFPKASHDGRLFMTLDPLDFLERISRFIPYPRRHRRHYHGVLAPSSPLRKQVAANAKKRLDGSKTRQETDEKVTKASRGWAQLIARIYEVDPLTCSSCGKKVKIITFVTHPEHIRRILRGIGWPISIPEFDPPPEEYCDDISQLNPNTSDGFAEPEVQVHYETDPDPPFVADIDSPHWED